MSFKPITVPPPGHAVATPEGLSSYATLPINLDVYHANANRVVLRMEIGSTAVVFELDAAGRDHLIARLLGEVAK